jgi:hypothetical protein
MLQSTQKNPRSGIWKKLITDPDPGVKKAPDPGSSTLNARIFQIFMGSGIKVFSHHVLKVSSQTDKFLVKFKSTTLC